MEENNGIYLDEFIQIANGLQEDGTPKSAGSLSIIQFDGLTEENVDKYDEKDARTIQEITVSTSAINMHISGGCAVVELDMPNQASFEYKNMMDMCKNWFKNLNDEKYDNQLLTFTVVPLLLEGKITIVFQGIVYYFGVQTEDGFRLILCFDNLFTQQFEVEGIDYNAIKFAIEEELRIEEEHINQQILEAEAEVKKLREAENPYVQSLKEGYGQDDLLDLDKAPDNESETKHVYGMRITKDE